MLYKWAPVGLSVDHTSGNLFAPLGRTCLTESFAMQFQLAFFTRISKAYNVVVNLQCLIGNSNLSDLHSPFLNYMVLLIRFDIFHYN